MELFTESDRTLIEALTYNPNLAPGYEILRGCLVWADETPDGISFSGRQRIHDLQTARSLLCHRTPLLEPISASLQRYYDDVLIKYRPIWDQALSARLQWPGFHPSRLELSDALLEVYRQMIHEPL
jgi:hypothetical protein